MVAPENTLAAFRRALEDGADGVELDVHLTADGHLVVIHDHKLDRTTNATGRIHEMSLGIIRQADAGAWFSSAFAGEQVPTLVEVLDLVTTWPGGGRHVLIELKGPISGLPALPAALLRCLKKGAPANPEMVARLLAVLARYSAEVEAGRIWVQSFYMPYLQELAPRAPRALPILYLSARSCRDCLEREDLQGTSLGLSGVSVLSRMISADAVQKLWRCHGHVLAWTVDTERQWQRMVAAGVHGIITNRPAELVRFLNSSQPSVLGGRQEGFEEDGQDDNMAVRQRHFSAQSL